MITFLIVSGLAWLAGLILLHRGVGTAPRASEDALGFHAETPGLHALDPVPVQVRSVEPAAWARESAF